MIMDCTWCTLGIALGAHFKASHSMTSLIAGETD